MKLLIKIELYWNYDYQFANCNNNITYQNIYYNNKYTHIYIYKEREQYSLSTPY